MNRRQLTNCFLGLVLVILPANAAKPPAKTLTNKRMELVALNNKAVIALNTNDFGLAIKNLEAALKLDPTYAKARETLSIAYNNYALKEISNPAKAIGYFHKSLFFAPDNIETNANLKGILEKSGKNPTAPEIRLEMARAASAKGELVEAIVEYRQALALGSKDPNVQKELKVAENKLNSKNDPVWKALPPPLDYKPFLEAMQRRIKRFWSPPKGTESRRIVALFKVHSDGHITHLKLQTASDNKAANDAALAAILKAAPFEPLPKGSVKDADIVFTFDYNVWQKALLDRQAEAQRLTQDIESLEKTTGKDSAKLIPLLVQLAKLYEVDGKYSESTAILTRALQLEEKASGSESASVAIIAMELGQLYSLAGKYTEAEPFLKRALDVREKISRFLSIGSPRK